MEIILGIAIVALVAYVFTRKKDVVEANDAPYKVEQPIPAGDIAPQPEPATTPIPFVPLAVEGAGAVEVPAEAPAKKPRAKKPAAPKAETTKAPAKPRAKKAKAE
jgi:monoamine oxidase